MSESDTINLPDPAGSLLPLAGQSLMDQPGRHPLIDANHLLADLRLANLTYWMVWGDVKADTRRVKRK